MPAWNAALHIREAIASILAQRAAAQFNIVVADDGSTDTTCEIVESIARDAPEVRVLRLQHRGVSAARNAALGAVDPDTEVVTFLDADDLSPPGRFDRDLPAFMGDDSLDVHWGMTASFSSTAAGNIPDATSWLERGSQLGALLVKTRLLARIGRFDETLPIAEDVDFLLRMLETQPRMSLSEDAVVYYRRHAGGMSRDTAIVRSALTRVYLAAAFRRKNGAPAVPAGLFVPRARRMQ